MGEDTSERKEEGHDTQAESQNNTPGLDKALRKKILEDPEATLPHLSLPQVLGGLVYLKISMASDDLDISEEDIQKRLVPVVSAITQYRTSQEAEAKGEKWGEALIDAFNQSLVKEGVVPKPKEKKAIKKATASNADIALEDTVSRIVEDAVGEDYDEGREERAREEAKYRELILKDPLATLKPATFEEIREGIVIVDKQLQKDGVRLEERQKRNQELAQKIIAHKTGRQVPEGEERWDRITGLNLRWILSQEGLTPLEFRPKTSENLKAQLVDYAGGILDTVYKRKK